MVGDAAYYLPNFMPPGEPGGFILAGIVVKFRDWGFMLKKYVSIFILLSCACAPAQRVKPELPRSVVETVKEPAIREKVLRGTWLWDIDSNSDESNIASDLWWEHVDAYKRYLVPENGSSIAILSGREFDKLTLKDIKKAKFNKTPISVSDTDPAIDIGSILAVKTNAGNYVKLQVTGFDPLVDEVHNILKYHLRLRYLLYRGT